MIRRTKCAAPLELLGDKRHYPERFLVANPLISLLVVEKAVNPALRHAQKKNFFPNLQSKQMQLHTYVRRYNNNTN